MKDETNLLHSSFGSTESIFRDVCQLFPSYPETEFIVESSEISSSPKVSLSIESPAQSVDSPALFPEETSILHTPLQKKKICERSKFSFNYNTDFILPHAS